MRFPRKLLEREWFIGDSIWRVRFHKQITEDERPKYYKGRFKDVTTGFCDEANQTIKVKTRLTDEDQVLTIVHEFIHAFEDEYGIKIPHAIVYMLEKPLAKFIIDNFF